MPRNRRLKPLLYAKHACQVGLGRPRWGLTVQPDASWLIPQGEGAQCPTRTWYQTVAASPAEDKPGRDSLVYDLMACERGMVDGMVLAFLGRTTLHYGDFTPVSDGSCRLHPQLAQAMVAVCRVDQGRLAEHARWLQAAL